MFDNVDVSERRFSPFEIKETTFKNGMGFAGTMVIDHFLAFDPFTHVALVGWCLNWSY